MYDYINEEVTIDLQLRLVCILRYREAIADYVLALWYRARGLFLKD
jgi:hypothetical protein